MKNRVGDKVASDKLNVYDCPRDSTLLSVKSFDHEGLETFNKPNIKTAKALNTVSTANAGWILSIPWNIYVVPGSIKIDDMIKDMGRGYL